MFNNVNAKAAFDYYIRFSKFSSMAQNNLVNLTPTHRWNTWNVVNNPQCHGSDYFTNENFQSKSRHWERIHNPYYTSHGMKKGVPFRVMSYNILAQLLLEFHSYLYENSSPNALIWDKRFIRIYNEIITQNPAIICLQELQFDHVDFLDSYLKKHDYKFIYKQRTGIRVDGCAIFYKASQFDLIEHESVEFCQPKADLLNRDNIGLMAKFRPKLLPSIPIVVCTTHLLYNPKRVDIRLAQAQVFLAEIDRFSFHMEQNSERPQFLPVIITGDFNSQPSSAVVKLLADGIVDLQYFDTKLKNISITNSCQHLGVYLQRKNKAYVKGDKVSKLYHSEETEDQNSDEKSKNQADNHSPLFGKQYIKHKLRLKSVYDFVKPDGSKEVTTHQNEWVTVDYIFYSSGNVSHLELTERYRLPSEKECAEVIGPIPNEQYGSDHFSLAAGFILKPKLPRSSV